MSSEVLETIYLGRDSGVVVPLPTSRDTRDGITPRPFAEVFDSFPQIPVEERFGPEVVVDMRDFSCAAGLSPDELANDKVMSALFWEWRAQENDEEPIKFLSRMGWESDDLGNVQVLTVNSDDDTGFGLLGPSITVLLNAVSGEIRETRSELPVEEKTEKPFELVRRFKNHWAKDKKDRPGLYDRLEDFYTAWRGDVASMQIKLNEKGDRFGQVGIIDADGNGTWLGWNDFMRAIGVNLDQARTSGVYRLGDIDLSPKMSIEDLATAMQGLALFIAKFEMPTLHRDMAVKIMSHDGIEREEGIVPIVVNFGAVLESRSTLKDLGTFAENELLECFDNPDTEYTYVKDPTKGDFLEMRRLSDGRITYLPMDFFREAARIARKGAELPMIPAKEVGLRVLEQQLKRLRYTYIPDFRVTADFEANPIRWCDVSTQRESRPSTTPEELMERLQNPQVGDAVVVRTNSSGVVTVNVWRYPSQNEHKSTFQMCMKFTDLLPSIYWLKFDASTMRPDDVVRFLKQNDLVHRRLPIKAVNDTPKA